jgi:hypothetical protein
MIYDIDVYKLTDSIGVPRLRRLAFSYYILGTILGRKPRSELRFISVTRSTRVV